MSFSRKNYDEGAYQHYVKESSGSGAYMLQTPRIDCNGCFYPSPHVRINSYGAAVCDKELVDVDSELMGLNRKQSKNPLNQYIPGEKEFCKVRGDMKDCHDMDPEDCRISNPPCTLRGTGWNRWEWMCQNPQDRAIIPFETLINNKMVVKDNHRPCVPRPLDPSSSLPLPQPADSGLPCNIYRVPQIPIAHVPGVPDNTWQKCNVISKY
jgi:hypothetical protein